jgi:hypothetical protein
MQLSRKLLYHFLSIRFKGFSMTVQLSAKDLKSLFLGVLEDFFQDSLPVRHSNQIYLSDS